MQAEVSALMRQWIAKYRTIFVICLAERMTYRTDFFLGTLMRFLPIVTTIFLWSAIFRGSEHSRIGGMDSREIVGYYLLVMISRAFSSMPGLASGISLDVREGNIKKYLIQPVNMIGFLLTMRIAHKLVYYTIALLPFAIVLSLCRGFFPSGWPPVPVLLAYLMSLALAFVIGFLFETWIGLLSFWLLDISSFGFIVMTLNYALSGHMFPLDLLPGPVGQVVFLLPFQYLAYFPAKIFLHGAQWTGGELLANLSWQASYALVLLLLVQMTFRRGLRRYSAFGG